MIGEYKINIGDSFGKLTVIDVGQFVLEPGGKRRRTSKVRCECGKEYNIRDAYLLRGTNKCIDCSYINKRIVKPNDKFGSLVVIKYEDKISNIKYGKRQVECKCDCGNIKIIRPESLLKEKFPSCGCSNSNYKGYEDISGVTYYRLQYNAKIRNFDFNLSIEFLWELYLKQNKLCALTNLPIKLFKSNGKNNNTASLDRIDSSKGYFENNVQWVHKDINLMKMDFDLERFYELCEMVVLKRKG